MGKFFTRWIDRVLLGAWAVLQVAGWVSPVLWDGVTSSSPYFIVPLGLSVTLLAVLMHRTRVREKPLSAES